MDSDYMVNLTYNQLINQKWEEIETCSNVQHRKMSKIAMHSAYKHDVPYNPPINYKLKEVKALYDQQRYKCTEEIRKVIRCLINSLDGCLCVFIFL